MLLRKRGWKSVICVLLCVAMMLSLGVTAFAGNADPSTLETAERALVLDYGFESIENGVVEDRSGNQFDGQLSGDQAALAGGVTGNGLALNGGYVRIPAKAIQGLTDVTISAQVYIKNLTPHSDYNGEAAIVKPTTLLFAGVADHSKSYAMLNTQSFDFDTFHEGCGWTINTPSYNEVRMAAAVDQHPAEGKWSDLAMVQEGTTVRVYLDGQLVREQTGVTAHLGDVYVDENTPVYIGRSDWGDFAPDGVIDNFRIYNYAMTAEELPRTDLVLDYEFEALEDGKVRDLSGNGFDGEVAGTAALTEAATGMGLNLEGAGDYVRVPAAVLKDLTDASIVGQVKLSSLMDVTGLFAGGSASGTFMSLNAKGIYAPEAGYQEGFTYAIQGKSGTQRRPTAKLEDVVPAGEWCTFAWVQSGSTVSLYLNGTLVATGDVGGDTLRDIYVNDETELYLGKPLDNWGDPKSYGIFDSFRIYSRALDASEIPGKPVEPEPPYVPTPFEEQVDYIQRAVNYLMNDGDALPQAKLDGVSVAWTLLEGDAEIRDGKLCKTETSQERQPVRLQAEVSMEGEQTQTLTFDHVTLMDPYVGYILSFFGVNGWENTDTTDAENFRIAYSYDGLHWSALNNNEAIVKPTKTVNDQGDPADAAALRKRVRDPFIMRNKDGSFTLMATQGWDHPNLFFWHSDDLTTFENERLIKVVSSSNGAGATGGRAWAPEGTYDPITDQYYVYWSDPNGNGGRSCTYYNTSADLETFSEVGVLFDPQGRHIDANIIKFDGTYYMDYRSYLGAYNTEGLDGIRMAKATKLGDRTFTSYTGDLNPWRSDSAAEGSFLFKVNGENRWYLYWDYNDIHQFGVMETTNLDSGEWTSLGINKNMPSDNVRHGGCTPVTQKELDAILEKWNPDGEALTVKEVESFDDISVTEAVAFADLNLPETAEVLLSNGKKVRANVDWSGEYQPGVSGSYPLTGTLSFSDEVKQSVKAASITSTRTASLTVAADIQTVQVSGVSLDKQTLELKAGESSALTAVVMPETATDKSVSWESSDESVASVENGTVTAKKPGTAVITVKTNDGGKTASCTVTVSCAHTELTAHAAKAATCTEAGSKAYWTCECGKWFYDAEGKTEITDHNDVILNALSHDFSDAWSSDDNEHWHECSRCDAVDAKAAHTWNEGEITTPATETENGVKTFTCTVCDRTKTEIIPAIGHQHKATFVAGKAATCHETGLKDAWYCAGCGKYFAEEACTTEIDRVIAVDPTNHVGETELRNAKVPTYTEDGYTGDTYCLGCGAMLAKGQVIPATGGSGIILPILPVNPGTPSYELPFVDVPEGEWYYESVYYAWDAGLINGTSPTTFRPDNTLTVAEAIKLAAALHQLESEGKVTLRNGQVNWYDTYVAYAVKEGIIEAKYQRYTVSQMNAPATRREFVHILHGALDDYAAINAIGENAIPDVKTGDTYAAEIYDFYRAGILTGSNAQGTFHPESSIKRSEVAAILIRMYDPSMRLEKTL